MKYEWKKSEKAIYGAKLKAELVDIPNQQFIMVDGFGNPNDSRFSDKVSALYALAYSIKMSFKFLKKDSADGGITDFAVYPLEGIWQQINDEPFDKDKLKYTIMIKQPDCITQEIFQSALNKVKQKKPNPLYDDIRFEKIEGGKSIQILHVGSYDDEPDSFSKMEKLENELGVKRREDFHREIYLSNKNRTDEAKLKTILRYSIDEIE